MEQIPSWGAANHEIPHVYGTRNVHDRVYKIPPLVLTQTNPLHNLPSELFKINFNGALQPTHRSPKILILLSRFSVCISHFAVRATWPSHIILNLTIIIIIIQFFIIYVRRWVDNIKMDLGEVGWDGVDWIGLAQDRDRWRAYCNAVMNLQVA
jgi:hypothetical protein